MRIGFILPGLPWRISGGYKVVYQYANALSLRGFEVTVFSLCDNTLKTAGLPEALRRTAIKISPARPRWFDLDSSVRVKKVLDVSESSFFGYDVLIATAISTAPLLSRLQLDGIKRFYFIQGYENWAASDGEIRESYKLPLDKIVISKWLSEIVENVTGSAPYYLPNPIDRRIFRIRPESQRSKYKIAVLYHEAECKGFSVAWKAILEAKKEIPEIEVEMFGTFDCPNDLPNWVTYYKKASEAELSCLYNRCGVYVCGSYIDSFGLTCLESICCGCALVSTRFPGVFEYTDEESALLCEVGDWQKLALSIVEAIRDDGLRLKMVDRSLRLAKEYDLSSTADLFASILKGDSCNDF